MADFLLGLAHRMLEFNMFDNCGKCSVVKKISLTVKKDLVCHVKMLKMARDLGRAPSKRKLLITFDHKDVMSMLTKFQVVN